MNYYTAVEIIFTNYAVEIPVIVEYDIVDDDVAVETIRLQHPQDEWFQPAIDSINKQLDYDHLLPEIRRESLARKIEQIASDRYDDLRGDL
jgi:hypothetical protein